MNQTSLLACALLLAGFAIAQAPLKFEVASVKPHPVGDNAVNIGPHPGGFAATGVPVKLLIEIAYRLKEYQVSGGPDWLNTEHYDILAKAAEGVNPTQEQMGPMLQALLADRFRLKVHRETKDLPVFALVVNKGGPKLKPAATNPVAGVASDEHPFADKGSGPMISLGHGVLMGQQMDMKSLADALGMQSDRAVVEKTGITGEFDLTLKWSPEAAQDTSGTSLFTAIEEQLGLKLESTRAPVEVLVIDSAERASGN